MADEHAAHRGTPRGCRRHSLAALAELLELLRVQKNRCSIKTPAFSGVQQRLCSLPAHLSQARTRHKGLLICSITLDEGRHPPFDLEFPKSFLLAAYAAGAREVDSSIYFFLKPAVRCAHV